MKTKMFIILKSVLKKMEFNEDSVTIDVFYPLKFRDYFHQELLDNEEENRSNYKDYCYERFNYDFDKFNDFLLYFTKSIEDARTIIRTELLVKSQIDRLGDSGFDELLGKEYLPLNQDLVQEVASIDVFPYQTELDKVWEELSNKIDVQTQPIQLHSPIQSYGEITHHTQPMNVMVQQYEGENHNNRVYPVYPKYAEGESRSGRDVAGYIPPIEADGIIELVSQDEINNDYKDFEVDEDRIYEDDEDIPC